MKKRCLTGMLACVLVATFLLSVNVDAAKDKWNVKTSDVDYNVELDGSTDVFICNKKTLGTKVGTKYYMTYTVESIKAEQFRQNGVIGTSTPMVAYPYATSDLGGGIYKYDIENKMLVQGNTYFLEFTITEDGYDYRIGWAEKDRSRYIEFEQIYGEVKTGLGYFGVFFGDLNISGKLVKVRAYDKNGNDLGIQVTPDHNAVVGREIPYAKDKDVDHTYTLEIKDGFNVAISNKRAGITDKVYMEYRVKESNTQVYQAGAIVANTPTANFPYESGQMLYNRYPLDPKTADDGPLLVKGAEYLIIFEKSEDRFDVTVQQTLNGKVTYIDFPFIEGSYYNDSKFFSLWYGGSPNLLMNAVLENFKCYDSNKNNLGVQTNSENCKITHYGEMEDYTGCEAVYYCDEDNSLFALYKDKSLKYTNQGITQKGTFRIKESVMKVKIGEESHSYNYLYRYFIDKEGKEYRRLHSYKVIFDTGKGSKVESQLVNADNGYVVLRPDEPTMENNTFEGWYTSDGKEYQFDQILTNSITLHAKWSETEYVSHKTNDNNSYMIVILAVICILGASTGGSIWILSKEKRHGRG